jgi:hypothetical protein
MLIERIVMFNTSDFVPEGRVITACRTWSNLKSYDE